MLTILTLLIGSVTIFILLPLVIVVLGIRQEPPTEELSQQAPSLLAAFVRRLLGLHVRKPDSPPNLDQEAEDRTSHVLPCPRTPMHKPNSDEREPTLFDASARQAIRIGDLRRSESLGRNEPDPNCCGR